MICPSTIQKKPDQSILQLHCNQCKIGQATLQNDICKKNILSHINKNSDITQLILVHSYIKVYQEKSLKFLKELAQFQEEHEIRKQLKFNKDRINNNKSKKDRFDEKTDIFFQFQQYKKRSQTNSSSITKQFIQKFSLLYTLPENISSTDFFHHYIRPYIRPCFIGSFIQMQPPPEAIFEKSYTITSSTGKQTIVTIYSLKDSPEKLYFLIPTEYQLSQQDVKILEHVQLKLSKHHPDTPSFLDSETSRKYFTRFAKKQIVKKLKQLEKNQIDLQHVDKLAQIFSQYSAGFGIIEDILHDRNVQDIYVNAPVQNNPIHLVVQGDEYSSNIFLSNQDIEALSSRFRSMSGRPFSEATPVLDMNLPNFNTRIAAIGQPLTPKGTAFAFRRHRKKPWTLSHFIANNMISVEGAGLLSFLVDGQASILIAGSRGAGKTSLLTALLFEIPQRFRILSIEDTSELPVTSLQKLGYRIQSLLTRSISSSADSVEMNPTDALRTALRLGESVLIIGEVRGMEAKVLFEAMRVGAAGNLIIGTIHGSSPLDVFERIVYDIGVAKTSFKAVDCIIIAAPIRKKGGVERIRRVTQISETLKQAWTSDISGEQVFTPLMNYDPSFDSLKQLPRISIGQSILIQQIAEKWGITVEQALENIKLRTHIKKQITNAGISIDKSFLEAECTRDANNQFWILIEKNKQDKSFDYLQIKKQWDDWFSSYIEKRKPS